MDEVQKLILKIEGEEKLAALNAQLRVEDDMLRKLVAAQAAGGGVGVSPAAVQAAAASVISLNKELATTKFSLANFQGSALQLQYIMDDLVNSSGDWTRHLASISNNIPGLVMSLGLKGGVAGTIGIISTGLIALTPLAKAAWDALAGDAPEVAKEKLKEIEKTIKGIDEAFEKLKNKPTNPEKEQAESVNAIFGERPIAERTRRALMGEFSNKAVLAGLNEQEMADIGTANKNVLTDEEIELRGGKEGAFLGRNSKVRQTLLDARSEALRRKEQIEQGVRDRMAKQLIEQAGTEGPAGNAALGRLTRMVEAKPDVFPDRLAQSLNGASVAGQKAWDDQMDKFNEDNESWSKRAHEARAARKKLNHEADLLNAQGARNEDAMNREQERLKQQDARELAQLKRKQMAEIKQVPVSDAQKAIANQVRRDGGNWTDAQTLEAAKAAVEMNQQGVGAQQAMQLAITAQINKMRALQQQYQQLQAESMRLQGGPDFSGQFSQMSPWSPSGY